jgi:hypothetical protein
VNIFLLSPARCDGRRTTTLLSPKARFPLALQLRESAGAPLGEVFAFLSGLYFRGKLTYARTFAAHGSISIRIITTNRGLLDPDERVRQKDVVSFGRVDLSRAGDAFLRPLRRDAEYLDDAIAGDANVVLLGSIASDKYVAPLLEVFGNRLVFPRDFIGRGDMSRGGLMLRQAQAGTELEYIPVANAVRHGKRPPKLVPLRGARARDAGEPTNNGVT